MKEELLSFVKFKDKAMEMPTVQMKLSKAGRFALEHGQNGKTLINLIHIRAHDEYQKDPSKDLNIYYANAWSWLMY